MVLLDFCRWQILKIHSVALKVVVPSWGQYHELSLHVLKAYFRFFSEIRKDDCAILKLVVNVGGDITALHLEWHNGGFGFLVFFCRFGTPFIGLRGLLLHLSTTLVRQ